MQKMKSTLLGVKKEVVKLKSKCSLITFTECIKTKISFFEGIKTMR